MIPFPRLVSLTCVLIVTTITTSICCCAWITHSAAKRRYHKIGYRRRIHNLIQTPMTSAETISSTINTYKNNTLDLNLLLIDHYDSFTYNLVDIVSQFTTRPPVVVKTDIATSWDEFLKVHHHSNTVNSGDPYVNSKTPFDGIILSPGPGHPNDLMSSLSRDCVRQNRNVPILGVCLGHQILGTVYGATVDLASEPIHGQVHPIRLVHDDSTSATIDLLWNGINNTDKHPIFATRYHSLHVTQLDGTDLLPTAYTDDTTEPATLMSMRHKVYPHFGVQFHPESIGTNVTGKILLENFANICLQYKQNRSIKATTNETEESSIMQSIPTSKHDKPQYIVCIHKVPCLPPNGANMRPIDIMDEILRDTNYTYWLDEARPIDPTNPGVSILGASTRRVEYWGKEKETSLRGIFLWDDKNTLWYKNQTMDILTYMYEQQTKRTEYLTLDNFDDATDPIDVLKHHSERIDSLPFDFLGGFVGYFGYETRHDVHHYHENFIGTSVSGKDHRTTDTEYSTVPTAAFLWADRSFVFDHRTDEWYLVGVHATSDAEGGTFLKSNTFHWMKSMSHRLSMGRSGRSSDAATPRTSIRKDRRPIFTPIRSRQTYNENFAQCMDYIRKGESYELCLTNQLESTVPRTPETSPLDLYKSLRRYNPAPFSALFNWNPNRFKESSQVLHPTSSFSICCTSPERFVSVKYRCDVDDTESLSRKFIVEAKPIKGTIRRVVPSNGRNSLTPEEVNQDRELAQKLHSSIKDRAENLMIVDLLRNDLSQVCDIGTVHVAKLMDIESYATVHQMVSTIRGTLRENANSMDVIKACFPGGSMTGAPKIRTMELLHQLEDGVSRGPYSGCFGYISTNGCMDMNIIIRTAVLTPEFPLANKSKNNDMWKIRIGAGGAITALSQPNDEYNEMLLKASAVIGAVEEWASVVSTESGDEEQNEGVSHPTSPQIYNSSSAPIV